MGFTNSYCCGLRHYKTPEIQGDILLIHGEQDDITYFQMQLSGQNPQKHPITILPGANHFLTGYLKTASPNHYTFYYHEIKCI